MGYLICNGMNGDEVCKEMPNEDLVYTGHYIDHETGIEYRGRLRCENGKKGKGSTNAFPSYHRWCRRTERDLCSHYQISASDDQGQQGSPLCQCRRIYKNVWDDLSKDIPEMAGVATEHFNEFEATTKFAEKGLTGEVTGIHAFYHENIFEASISAPTF